MTANERALIDSFSPHQFDFRYFLAPCLCLLTNVFIEFYNLWIVSTGFISILTPQRGGFTKDFFPLCRLLTH